VLAVRSAKGRPRSSIIALDHSPQEIMTPVRQACSQSPPLPQRWIDRDENVARSRTCQPCGERGFHAVAVHPEGSKERSPFHATRHVSAHERGPDERPRCRRQLANEVGKVFHGTRESLPIADYSYVRRFNNGTLNSQMSWATVFFVGEGSPENMTLHGSHDLDSGDEVGSVSAASATHATRIGHQFTRVGVTLTIG
jgi:hypothetical protein